MKEIEILGYFPQAKKSAIFLKTKKIVYMPKIRNICSRAWEKKVKNMIFGKKKGNILVKNVLGMPNFMQETRKNYSAVLAAEPERTDALE